VGGGSLIAPGCRRRENFDSIPCKSAVGGGEDNVMADYVSNALDHTTSALSLRPFVLAIELLSGHVNAGDAPL
jgi:hypothetical protein